MQDLCPVALVVYLVDGLALGSITIRLERYCVLGHLGKDNLHDGSSFRLEVKAIEGDDTSNEGQERKYRERGAGSEMFDYSQIYGIREVWERNRSGVKLILSGICWHVPKESGNMELYLILDSQHCRWDLG
ncbi:MAG: hypothetical protein M1820_010128 [Bogoriella megaspora]|nr:MAG: hypothetical protein M1820_010128 [Bogoriella megaspora]